MVPPSRSGKFLRQGKDYTQREKKKLCNNWSRCYNVLNHFVECFKVFLHTMALNYGKTRVSSWKKKREKEKRFSVRIWLTSIDEYCDTKGILLKKPPCLGVMNPDFNWKGKTESVLRLMTNKWRFFLCALRFPVKGSQKKNLREKKVTSKPPPLNLKCDGFPIHVLKESSDYFVQYALFCVTKVAYKMTCGYRLNGKHSLGRFLAIKVSHSRRNSWW